MAKMNSNSPSLQSTWYFYINHKRYHLAPPSSSLVNACMRCSPLGSSAHSPRFAIALLVSKGTWGHPHPSCGPSLTPCKCLSNPEDWRSFCFSGTVLSFPEGTRPGLSLAPRGAPPPWMPFVSLILFSPSSYLDRNTNPSHCSIPAVLSLNLRPNS